MTLTESQREMVTLITESLKLLIPTGVNSTAPVQDSTAQPKPPPFSVQPYRSADGTTVADYFTRFKWALNLSKIPDDQHANYVRVHMGTEFNDALKFLISPRKPEDSTYDEIVKVLQDHFDSKKNKYAESVKFRLITQTKDETLANFALRLKQGAAHCEYGEFLDRMLIEQVLHGLYDRSMCDEIISKKPETFQDAYAIAHALESAHLTTEEVKSQSLPTETTHTLLSTAQQYKQNSKPTNNPNTRVWQRNAPTRTRSNESLQQNLRQESRKPLQCYGCGAPHFRWECPFARSQCNFCKKK